MPLPNAKTDPEELASLQHWLDSYNISEIIDVTTGSPKEGILRVVPPNPSKRLGQSKFANGDYEILKTPEWQSLAVEKGTQDSCMKRVGQFLLEVIKEYVSLFSRLAPLF